MYTNESYDFLSSNLYILLKDQMACKFLQEKLEKDSNNFLTNLFPDIILNITEFIKDSFANYFIQKMFHYLNEEQILYILKLLHPNFLDICIDKHGTRVIQRIMDYLTTYKTRQLFFYIIKPIFCKILNEYNGTHIIYKFFQFFPEFLVEANDIIIVNISIICINKRGCVFLENYLSNLYDINLRDKTIQSILDICQLLIIDKFGNYIIQYLLSLRNPNIILNIIDQIKTNIKYYCMNKYANFVIEKLLIYSNYTQKQFVIQNLLINDTISDLAFNQHGNFIILQALNFADGNKRNLILKILKNLRPKIEELPNGKIFLKKLEYYSFNK